MKEIRLEIEELEERIAPLFAPLGHGHAQVAYFENGDTGILNTSGFHVTPAQADHGLMTASS